MGTKTSSFHQGRPRYHCRYSEKRIPKHGDENSYILTILTFFFIVVKKESPNMGTKTGQLH